VTDRKGRITEYEYDALDRLVLVTYDDESSIAYTYDAGDRLTEIDTRPTGRSRGRTTCRIG
jgi:YD repeat-containing protein